MKISLKPGWESKVFTITPRVYLFSSNTKWFIDPTFDEMQRLGHFKYTISHTLFDFPVFIVWKTDTNEEKKAQADMNISKLNNLIIYNTYSLPLQLEIIANI